MTIRVFDATSCAWVKRCNFIDECKWVLLRDRFKFYMENKGDSSRWLCVEQMLRGIGVVDGVRVCVCVRVRHMWVDFWNEAFVEGGHVYSIFRSKKMFEKLEC